MVKIETKNGTAEYDSNFSPFYVGDSKEKYGLIISLNPTSEELVGKLLGDIESNARTEGVEILVMDWSEEIPFKVIKELDYQTVFNGVSQKRL